MTLSRSLRHYGLARGGGGLVRKALLPEELVLWLRASPFGELPLCATPAGAKRLICGNRAGNRLLYLGLCKQVGTKEGASHESVGLMMNRNAVEHVSPAGFPGLEKA